MNKKLNTLLFATLLLGSSVAVAARKTVEVETQDSGGLFGSGGILGTGVGRGHKRTYITEAKSEKPAKEVVVETEDEGGLLGSGGILGTGVARGHTRYERDLTSESE